MTKVVGIIGCAGIPANYGGFETLAEQLVLNLQQDFSFVVYCSSKNYTRKPSHFLSAQLIYVPLKANGRMSIFYDAISIIHALKRVDVMLVLGVGAAFLFPFIRFFTKKVIVVNIDGLEWKRNKWGRFARFYLRLQESIAVRYAHKVIADNEAIVDHVRQSYSKSSFYVAYGGDHARPLSLVTDFGTKWNLKVNDYYFSVCRIEPENNIHVILEAFAAARNRNLIFVGNWQASKYGQHLYDQYKHHKNLNLLNPIYDLKDLDQLRSNCYAYIHGHSAGGTNPSLVEAMHLKVPIIAYDVSYNRYSTENSAIYFRDTKELVSILENYSEELLLKVAESMFRIAHHKYTWMHVANLYKSAINDF